MDATLGIFLRSFSQSIPLKVVYPLLSNGWADSSGHADTAFANKSSKTSIGLRQFNVLRGLPFSSAATLIKFLLRVQGQIGSLGEVLAEKPVGVLVAAALPRGCLLYTSDAADE